MNNDLRTLDDVELDSVCGGTGSLSDVMTYVKSYTAALGTVPTVEPKTDICEGQGVLCQFGF
jgi:hypothetical protein